MSIKKRVNQICCKIRSASFAVAYWDGDRVHYGSGAEEFVIHLDSEAAVKGLFSNLKLRLAEAYMDGAIDIEGDLERFVRLVFLLKSDDLELGALGRAALSTLALRQRNSRDQAKKNIQHHYDLGNDFYRLWLGAGMVYSCAYFHRPDDGLDQAQQQKLRHLCAKLRLQPGHRVLDVGCGWGQLLLYAAKEYGVQGVGVTVSEEQVDEARMRIAERELGHRVAVSLRDYRDIPLDRPFDRIISVGMFEHVGREFIDTYFQHTSRLLRKGGCGVLHTMGRMRVAPTSEWLRKYIFPGMYFPSLDEIATSMGQHDLTIVDIENMRLHYALTIDRWIEEFERNSQQIQHMFDERFIRMWRLYLHSAKASFKYGDLQVWQITYTKGLDNEWPLQRNYLYE
ncbi:MAG: cyclopropane-fatty-acyl-phospholipid synthase family protein [Proteobacteria bacterium]|nr:cyclopropane-fatty-acyl-phospholipid synthase family protein [Pseudomonadota bacterium]